MFRLLDHGLSSQDRLFPLESHPKEERLTWSVASSIAAAAAVLKLCWGRVSGGEVHYLTIQPQPTNELKSWPIIIALEQALGRYDELDSHPYLDVKIYSDSKYAILYMNERIHTWFRNGQTNSRNQPISNQDLIQEAFGSGRQGEGAGQGGIYLDSEENHEADGLCNDCMDEQ